MDGALSETEGPVSSFQTYGAEGDILAKQASFEKAIESYTKALQLRPGEKNCLVFRSKCYLLLGDAAAALKDANDSLVEDKDFFKGIFQKAEALYATGDFEMALVYYHRGNKLRPEFNDFRLGIQKASEAIDNSIGNPRDYKFQPPTCSKIFNSIPDKSMDSAGSTVRTTSTGRTTKNEAAVPIANREGNFEVKVKQLLGELYVDRIYLEEFLYDKDFVTNPNEEVIEIVRNAISYLETRTEFWRQQKPIYVRRKEHSNIQSKATNAKNRRVAREKAKEKVAIQNGIENPNSKQVQNANLEQKIFSAGLKSAYNSLERKDYAAALGAAESMLLRLGDIMDQRQKNHAMAECYSILGITHLEIGGYAQAVLYHKKDLSIAIEQGFPEGQKRAYVNLARSYVVLKRFKEAAKMFRDRLALCKSSAGATKDEILLEHVERAWLLHDIARCHVELGQFDIALQVGDESTQEAEKSRDKSCLLDSKMLTAQLRVRMGQGSQAHPTLIQAYGFANELGDKDKMALILSEIERVESSDEFTGQKVFGFLKKQAIKDATTKGGQAPRPRSASSTKGNSKQTFPSIKSKTGVATF